MITHVRSSIFRFEKLMKYLKAEKACRTDLEMYVAVINVI